ncbi:terminase small subunit [Acinetobacter phage AB1]|mgnify:CR=1 FL=1|uniref:AB1gp33 n=3 Tax=root TaxID=1 RepID=E2GLX1_9CAUD|nr:terminase small subunit [Thermovibrio guaymasensis]YP_009592179.1 terminase small subunit [Acinetobacter phage vB_AbaM-IME-AB2]YP_009613798.1 terminase small subunit [Acinetobacter phage AB1]ADO14404.1 AB1gp33 [Acinetobacter phage AB1]AFV51512.1 putative phage terminase small subunit [Acinetobacter phage vB_AbaM-IME-AB2]RKQ59888.1 DNA-packaging protein gp3 [Thermovibrio guaymasensis]
MASVGKPRAIESPEDFEELAFEYIEWVKNNPVMKTITASFQGSISYEKVPHARPMTQYGLAAHMGIGLSTLKDYGQREEYSAMFKRICAIMTAHNVDGATSGDMSANIISRIEGLAEKQEVVSNVTVNNSLDDFYADIQAETKAES